jgi:hypothetical protein
MITNVIVNLNLELKEKMYPLGSTNKNIYADVKQFLNP